MRSNLPEDILERFERCPARLSDFFPQGLIKTNCGSNIGLCEVMLDVLKTQDHDKPDPPKKYFAMTADLNIFDRIIKVRPYFGSYFKYLVDDTVHSLTRR